jgi:hypothetical protein
MPFDKKLLKQLTSSDPQQRRKAVVGLANSKDPAAIPPLIDTSRNDPDEKVRALAEKAAAHLRTLAPNRDTPEPGGQASPFISEKPVKVPPKDIATARSYMDDALSMQINKETGKATRSLAKALQTNPNLKTDSYFLGLAASILNVQNDEAIAMLVSGEQRGEFIRKVDSSKVQLKREEHYAKTDELTWVSVGFDLAVFAAIIIVITFLTPIITTQLVQRLVTSQAAMEMEKLEQEAVRLPPELKLDAIQQIGPGTFLISGVVAGLLSTVGFFIQGGLIHLVATKLFKGNGTMRYMMCQITPYFSYMYAVFFVWFCIILLMITSGLAIPGLLCMAIFTLASLVVFIFKPAGRIGQAYDFGVGKGCLSMFIANFLVAIIPSIISFVIGQSVMSSLMTSLGLS